MDISPLYELRLRLKNAMISGCGLMEEDFRLKRAAGAMKPLEAASPVFAKIGQLLGMLLSEDCRDRSGVLLDTMTLVDAVCCTQGAVNVPGEVREIETAPWGSAVTNAPYSVLHTLLDALATSGGGRYALVMETHENHPELFEDYRVKPALVRALGASYAELAEQAARWLKEGGDQILPLLYKDFDPKGKKEMVRRVQVIDAIAGEKANDFYLEKLPEAEKEVRGALIYALRHDPENSDFLMELSKTEKGNNKKMALWALVSMSGEAVETFWKAYMKKKPGEAASYLAESCTGWASYLVAESLKELLSPWVHDSGSAESRQELTKEQAGLLYAHLRALPGKTGPAVEECFRMAAGLKGNLDRKPEGEKAVWNLSGLPGCQGYKSISFQKAIPNLLRYMFYMKPNEGLGKLAVSLCEELGDDYFPAAGVAKMLFAPQDDFAEWMDGKMHKKSLLGVKLNRDAVEDLCLIFENVFWDERIRSYVLRISLYSEADEQRHEFCQPVSKRFDGYFTDLFMECRHPKLDGYLARWIQPDNREYCEKLRDYFYNRARTVQDNRMYLEPLRKLGLKECSGLAMKYFKSKNQIYGWDAWNYLNRMPGTWEAKLKEAEELYELVDKKQIKGLSLKERLEEFMDLARSQMGSEIFHPESS